jgi:hypothetical protein
MSTITNTAQAAVASRLRLPRRLVMLILVAALAVVALTAAVLATSGSGASGPQHAAQLAPQRQYHGGPAEVGRAGSEPQSAPTNDGSQRSGARP